MDLMEGTLLHKEGDGGARDVVTAYCVQKHIDTNDHCQSRVA